MFDFFKKKDQDPYNGRDARKNTKEFLESSGTGSGGFFNTTPQAVEISSTNTPVDMESNMHNDEKKDDRIPASTLRGLLEHINQERRTFAYKISGNGIRSGYIPRAERNESDGDPYREMLASIEGLMDLSETNRKLMSRLELRDLLTDVLHNKGNFSDVVDFDR